MPTHSKWESLPTEAINPVSLSVDKSPVPDIIDMVVPRLPIEPGAYQLSIQLMTPDPEASGQRILLDTYGWLNGNGVTLEVEGEAAGGLSLPTEWSVCSTTVPNYGQSAKEPRENCW